MAKRSLFFISEKDINNSFEDSRLTEDSRSNSSVTTSPAWSQKRKQILKQDSQSDISESSSSDDSTEDEMEESTDSPKKKKEVKTEEVKQEEKTEQPHHKNDKKEEEKKSPTSSFVTFASDSKTKDGGISGTRHERVKSITQTDYPLPEKFHGKVSIFQDNEGGMAAAEKNGSSLPEHYFVGVIDILMLYSFRKKMEHIYKGMKYSKEEISAIGPVNYSKRFQAFLKQFVLE